MSVRRQHCTDRRKKERPPPRFHLLDFSPPSTILTCLHLPPAWLLSTFHHFSLPPRFHLFDFFPPSTILTCLHLPPSWLLSTFHHFNLSPPSTCLTSLHFLDYRNLANSTSNQNSWDSALWGCLYGCLWGCVNQTLICLVTDSMEFIMREFQKSFNT